MDHAEIKKIAEPIARAALGAKHYRGIQVFDYEDALGEPSIKIVIKFADAPRGLSAAISSEADLGISGALRKAGESRYPYVDFKYQKERARKVAA